MIFQAVFGSVQNPLCRISATGCGYGGLTESGGGLIGFASNIIRLITIVAGIWAMFNLIFAGFAYVTSQGDPKALEAARSKIFMSIIGLIIIAASFIMAAIFGQILFGDYTAILNPQVFGPQ